MTYLRALTIGVALWLSLAYNIGGIVGVEPLTQYSYALAIFYALLLILVPPISSASLLPTLGSAILLLYLSTVLGGLVLDSATLTSLLADIGVIGITIILAREAGIRIGEIQETFAELGISLGISKLSIDAEPFNSGQRQIYREIRRARRYNRAVTLLAVSISTVSMARLLERPDKRAVAHRLIRNVQHEVLKNYTLARTANLLVHELEDSAVVTQRGEHFIVLVSEADRDEIRLIMDRLKAAADEMIGVELNIGASTFPDEAVTFERLLQRAEAAMTGMRSHPREKFVFIAEPPRSKTADSIAPEIRANDEVVSSSLRGT